MAKNEMNHKQHALPEDDLPSTSKQKFVAKNSLGFNQMSLSCKGFGKNDPFKQHNGNELNTKSVAKQKHANGPSVSCPLPPEKKRKSINKKIQTAKFYIKWPTKFKFADDSSITRNKEPLKRTDSKSLKNQKIDSSTKGVVSNKHGEKFYLKFIELPSQSKSAMENIKHSNTLTGFQRTTSTTRSLVSDITPEPYCVVKQQSKIFRFNDTKRGNVSDVPSTSKRTLNEKSYMPVIPLKLIKIERQKIVEIIDLNSTTFPSSKKVYTTLPFKSSACEIATNSVQDAGRTYLRKEWDDENVKDTAKNAIPPTASANVIEQALNSCTDEFTLKNEKPKLLIWSGVTECSDENVEYILPHGVLPQFSTYKTEQTPTRDFHFLSSDDIKCNDTNAKCAAPLPALIDRMEQPTSSYKVKFLVSSEEVRDDDNAEYILPDTVPRVASAAVIKQATNSLKLPHRFSNNVCDDDNAEYIVPDIVPPSASAVFREQTINSFKVLYRISNHVYNDDEVEYILPIDTESLDFKKLVSSNIYNNKCNEGGYNKVDEIEKISLIPSIFPQNATKVQCLKKHLQVTGKAKGDTQDMIIKFRQEDPLSITRDGIVSYKNNQ
ncbi:uncharacterized protein LOC119687943 [Teleopsis dalmanni]|uniref:uncharacterized protein LOC119687943 n=1 Tax=Teleopsis dalmanni TaxID=139649 RepID=UPI0018CF3D77|nr:uncharacterized protein LOC119687943 [Teleopsis dalmanni]